MALLYLLYPIALALRSAQNVIIRNMHVIPKRFLQIKCCTINSVGAVLNLPTETTSQASLIEERFLLTQSTAILDYVENQFPLKLLLLLSLCSVKHKAAVTRVAVLLSQDISPLADHNARGERCLAGDQESL